MTLLERTAVLEVMDRYAGRMANLHHDEALRAARSRAA